MSNAHEQAQPCHHHTGDEIDVVPGTPPVPITVWRTPSDEPGPHLGPRLAARLLAAYTRPGEAVYDTTGDPLLRQVATATGRHYHADGTGRCRSQVQLVALAVTRWPTDPDRDLDPVLVYGGLRRRLRPGGILAVILAVILATDQANQPADAAGLVDVATAAGLSYLQHIVAVHAHATGDQFTPPDHATAAPAPGGAAHLKVHSDLMIFTRPVIATSSANLKGGRDDA
jgi:hypothetical protein